MTPEQQQLLDLEEGVVHNAMKDARAGDELKAIGTHAFNNRSASPVTDLIECATPPLCDHYVVNLLEVYSNKELSVVAHFPPIPRNRLTKASIPAPEVVAYCAF